jgi:hypothetical protein
MPVAGLSKLQFSLILKIAIVTGVKVLVFPIYHLTSHKLLPCINVQLPVSEIFENKMASFCGIV